MARSSESKRTVEERVRERLLRAFRKIARELGVPVVRIRRIAAQLEWLGAVRQFRNEGLLNREIAERLGLSHGYVHALVNNLLRKGATDSRRGMNRLDQATRLAREQAVLAGRLAGRTYQDIAAELHLSKPTVALVGRRLVAQGKAAHHLYGYSCFPRQSWKLGGVDWRDLQNERVQLVIGLKRDGATLQEIGAALGVSRERARQILLKLAKLHGEWVLKSERWCSQTKAAQLLQVSSGTIAKQCRELGIVTAMRRTARLTEAQLQAIKARLGQRCVICGRPLHLGRRHKLCDNGQCKRAHSRRARDKMLTQTPSEANLRGWHRQLLTRLQGHEIPAGDEWLTQKEAVAVAGISPMQLSWLRLRRILTTRPHPTKKSYQRNGQPAYTFARSELELVRKVYAAHRSKAR